jgi:hypothetical protein
VYYNASIGCVILVLKSMPMPGKNLQFCNDIKKLFIEYQLKDIILLDDFYDPRINLRQSNLEYSVISRSASVFSYLRSATKEIPLSTVPSLSTVPCLDVKGLLDQYN